MKTTTTTVTVRTQELDEKECLALHKLLGQFSIDEMEVRGLTLAEAKTIERIWIAIELERRPLGVKHG